MAHLKVIKGGGGVVGMGLADYIWLDDHGDIVFKKKSILITKDEKGEPIPILDRWTFYNTTHTLECQGVDGCDCPGTTRILVPFFYLPDPTRPQPNYIVLCEMRGDDDYGIESDFRGKVREALDLRGKPANLVWFGFEQDYSHQEADEEEDPQFEARRFQIAERHIGACFDAGLLFHSAWNPPLAPEWDFKIGYRGFPQDLDPDPPNALVVADHLIIARYLMEKIGASKGLSPCWSCLSVFVSTPALREPGTDVAAVSEYLSNALKDIGKPRLVPHPTRGGVQCVEVTCDSPADPYALALNVLNAVWPILTLE